MTDSLPYSMTFANLLRWVAVRNIDDFRDQSVDLGPSALATEREVLEAIADGRLASFGCLRGKPSRPIPAAHWLSHRVISIGDESVFASIEEAVALMDKVDGNGPVDVAMIEDQGSEVWRNVIFRRPDVLKVFKAISRPLARRRRNSLTNEEINAIMEDAIQKHGGPNLDCVEKAVMAHGVKRDAVRALYRARYGSKRGPKGPRRTASKSNNSAS